MTLRTTDWDLVGLACILSCTVVLALVIFGTALGGILGIGYLVLFS